MDWLESDLFERSEGITAHTTMDIAGEERCSLCDLCLDVRSRKLVQCSPVQLREVQESEEFVGELVS
jgi:hypothetical protein